MRQETLWHSSLFNSFALLQRFQMSFRCNNKIENRKCTITLYDKECVNDLSNSMHRLKKTCGLEFVDLNIITFTSSLPSCIINNLSIIYRHFIQLRIQYNDELLTNLMLMWTIRSRINENRQRKRLLNTGWFSFSKFYQLFI